ncbi:MAG TPA: hypothetical protein VF593_11745 [Chthoniobacteraceae bacterium]
MKSLRLIFCALLIASPLCAAEPATFEVGGIKFARPAEWAWIEVTSPMRKAQLKVPGTKAGEAADITFFHFGTGAGGDVQANAQRWIGQFKDGHAASKIGWKEIGGTRVTIVTTEGTFNSGMPGGPSTPLENQALLGAIIGKAEGNVFVKMTGPAELVKSSREKFMEFVTAALSTPK